MNSIRTRLLVMLLAGLSVVLFAGGATVYAVVRYSLLRQFDTDLETRAHTLASLVKMEPQGLVFERGDAPGATVAETFFELRDQQGVVLKQSQNLGEGTLSHRSILVGDFQAGDAVLVDDLDVRVGWLSFLPRLDPDDWTDHDIEGETVEPLTIVVALDRRPISRAMRTLLMALMAVGGAAGLAATGLVLAGTRWGLRPLRQLSAGLGEVSAMTLSRRFHEGQAAAELKPIYRELNGMIERVQHAMERERLFVDAAAHELRTPLSELRLVAELAIKWPDANRLLLAVQEAHAIGEEMERLVESLLLISSAHAPELRSQVVLAPLIMSWVRRNEGLSEQKELQWRIKLDERAVWFMSGTAAEVVVRNLVHNAVAHTPLQGEILVRTEHSPADEVSLVVENRPVNLTSPDLPRMFEPFWQKDAARSDRAHGGLGLAVVRSMADASGLRLHVELEGDLFRVRASLSPESGDGNSASR